MAEMKAKRSFVYAGKRVEVDESFETQSDRDAVLLETVGHARRTTSEKKVEKRKYKTAEAKADAPVVPPPVALDDEVTGRFYNRRDMEPE